MTLIEGRQLCKHFHAGQRTEVRAVDDVSLTIAAGSFCVITGASGSGKTTLLSLLGLLSRPTSGRVFFRERDLSGCGDVELARVRRRVGFVFQNSALLPRLAVWDNVTYPLIPRSVARRRRYEIAAEWLRPLGMIPKMQSRPEELSAGEQQRVAFARALAGDPEALFADEPTSQLDRGSREALSAILCDFHKSGKTVIVATHDDDVAALATCVVEMEQGKLVRVTPRGG